MAWTMRKLRLRSVWLLVIPFLWLSAPTLRLVAVGASLGIVGLWIRGWSAGTIHKDEELTVCGPYAFTRNPLYLGSFFLGAGVSIAGGHWLWPAAFVVFYAVIYSRTMSGEVEHLGRLFPERYADYVSAVPGFLPRFTPYRPAGRSDEAGGFRWAQYRRNREWEASLGALAAFTFLAAKAVWL